MDPVDCYKHDLRRDGFESDPMQQEAVQALQQLYAVLNGDTRARKQSVIDRLLNRRPEPVKGIYLWGDTGRGKTWLMDRFFHCLNSREKHRLHFHRFMCEVHKQMNDFPRMVNPLKAIAKHWAKQYRLLCLDEFHVSDIGDAMILGGLLEALFQQGVILVTTSNIPIQELYKNGLQRERFLPAIALLQKHTQEIALGDGKDYRFSLLERNNTYHVEPQLNGHRVLQDQFELLANLEAKTDRHIQINNRDFHYVAWANDVIWFDFDELCTKPRSANDYLEIARYFNAVFISDIPCMDEGKDDVAKRFVHLIDTLYDNKVKLIVSAEAEPRSLYRGRRVAFEFERTVSRLTEMASRDYLAEHRHQL